MLKEAAIPKKRGAALDYLELDLLQQNCTLHLSMKSQSDGVGYNQSNHFNHGIWNERGLSSRSISLAASWQMKGF